MIDTVIVGSGLAALCTALAIEPSRNVLLLTKDKLITSNTYLAQGGIAASLDQSEKSIESHINDTIKAGASVNDEAEVEHLVRNSKLAIDFLVNKGCKFDTNESGEFCLTREGGHSMRRILHAGGDATGRHMIDDLLLTVHKQNNIQIVEEAYVKEIGPKGITYFHNDEIIQVSNANIVICTGGANNIFQSSTNPSVTNGNGVMFANQTGLELENMHYIQFHPTTYHALNGKGQRFLVSEAVRGEGAILKNENGQAFMQKYHPLKDLAPRDVVSRAIDTEIKRQHNEFVYLDARHLGRDFLCERFPTIYQHLATDDIYMEKDLIPVSPAAHYTVGGIKTDCKGRTNIENIYACGECASTGIHGANRLASNSLLECVVYAQEIANEISKQAPKSAKQIKLGNCDEAGVDLFSTEIEAIISAKLGIIRNASGIAEAFRQLKAIQTMLLNTKRENKQWYEQYSKVISGLMIIESFEQNPKSLGCHAMGE